jgi:hypothetical protein
LTGAVDVWTDPELAELVRDDACLVALADALTAGEARRAGGRRGRRAAIAVAAALVAVVAALAPAVALSKGLRAFIGLGAPVRIHSPRVYATLTSSIPVDARPGIRIRVRWKLWSRGEHGRMVPVTEPGTFARIVNPARTAATSEPAHRRRGEYAALVRVPPGGIGRVQIGVHAWRFGPSGQRPAIFFFPITNHP